MIKALLSFLLLLLLTSCDSNQSAKEELEIDFLIVNASVFDGVSSNAIKKNIGLCEDRICYLGNEKPSATNIIDATDLVATPGFIDPHTHSLEELTHKNKNSNLNYLMQGVTTVINGNDGDGSADIVNISQELTLNGIGTNVGLLVGHGAIRAQVMGIEERVSTIDELNQMKLLLDQAMEQGSLGLSSGLYYVPGVYSDTNEVIELAKIAANHGGVYDTHLRDESTFNIGFLNAVKEAIQIAENANIHLHIAHIKALGVDVWGQSKDAIQLIKDAQKRGVSISADQYPWQASGTYLNSAVMPSWVRADSDEKFKARLIDSKLIIQIQSEITENIRRRGGPHSLLITEAKNKNWLGKNLAEISQLMEKTPAETAIAIALEEKVRVASFNMSKKDIHNFMKQQWVLSSSDGTNGHPRKFASFPKKYQEYVKEKNLMSFGQFVKQSSSKTAEVFNIGKRGIIAVGYYADINLLDLNTYQPKADFSSWNQLSTGVEYQFVNGQMVIQQGVYKGTLAGVVLERSNNN